MNPTARRYILMGFAAIAALLYIIRLFYVQVVNDSYKLTAQNQAFFYATDYPPRGNIYDRNGKKLVVNQVAYDLMVVPRNMKGCDTVELCKILNIDTAEFHRRLIKFCGSLKLAKGDYRTYIFETQMLPELNARIQERLYKFNGFFVQARTVRQYVYPVAAHLLGYIAEVGPEMEDTNAFYRYYKSGDYIGKSGIEKAYEEQLRGKKGVQILMRDVHNNIKGSYKNGLYDTASVPGQDLTCTLDADLQLLGEKLMVNKIGGIAAIDPSTGEILALVTSPTYDPNLLVGRDLKKNYLMLLNDSVRPLFNRALQASYPPGSTFKLMDALIGQQEGVLTPQTLYPCHSGFTLNKGVPGCHAHASPLDLNGAISQSCNSYFSWVFKTIMDNPKFHGNTQTAFENWRRYILSFGPGTKLGTDLPFDSKGNVPTVETYNGIFGKGWHTMNVISLGIGQAELGLTPLQMCNVVCSIANRGYYYSPHVIKKVGNANPLEKWKLKHYTLVTDQDAYENVISAMANVLITGTARASAIPGIDMCGKTGTAQNPHGDNHSVFVCFAPRVNPKICVAVLVENAGQGAWWGAPIASLMVEQYLKGGIPEPARQVILKRMENGDIIHMDPKIKRTNPAYSQDNDPDQH